MAPKPAVIRDDISAPLLLEIAQNALNDRSREKYEALASVRDGTTNIEALTKAERAVIQRYIREINAEPDINALLSPVPAGSKNKPVEPHNSPEELRSLAEQAQFGPYRTGLMTLAILMEIKNIEKAMEHGFTRQHIQKLVARYNAIGLEGLGTSKLSTEEISLLEDLQNETTDPNLELRYEALLAFETEGLTSTQIHKRFGIPPGTFDGYLKQFKTRGALAFLGRSQRMAEDRVAEDTAEELDRIGSTAKTPVTAKRCSAVAACLRGGLLRPVAAAHNTKPDVLVKWMKGFNAYGNSALISDKELVRPDGDDLIKTLAEYADQWAENDQVGLLKAAADFYAGKSLLSIQKEGGPGKDKLKRLLFALQVQDFSNIKTVVNSYMQRATDA